MFGFESALRQLIRLGPDGTVRQAHPITMDPSLVGDAGEAVPSRQSFRLARSLGKPVYSKAYPYFTNDWQFEVRVPVSRDGRIGGFAPELPSAGDFSHRARRCADGGSGLQRRRFQFH